MNLASIIILSIGLACIILYLARLLDDWYKQKLNKRNMEKLPEKWCIKPKGISNDLQQIWEYCAKKYGDHESCTSYYHYPPFDEKRGYVCSVKIQEGYTEISFEDFKRLVLKKESIPEYVECIRIYGEDDKSMTPGKIYKTDKKQCWFDNHGYTRNTLEEVLKDGDFKPSTQAAFEAQFKPKEPELIEGNWYEGIGKESSNRWLFKYKSGPDKYGTMTNFNSCTPIDGYISHGGTNRYKDIKPANMEEVWKFFPEEKEISEIVRKLDEFLMNK